MRYVTKCRLVAGACLGIAGFQVALAAGAPLGAISWGGQHQGVLPDQLRVASIGSGVVWAGFGGALLVSASRPSKGTSRLLWAICALTAAGAVTNLASQSTVERMLWVPVPLAISAMAASAARQDLAGELRGPRVAPVAD